MVRALQVDTTVHKLGSYRWLQSQACEFVWKKETKEGRSTKCSFDITIVHSTRRFQHYTTFYILVIWLLTM